MEPDKPFLKQLAPDPAYCAKALDYVVHTRVKFFEKVLDEYGAHTLIAAGGSAALLRAHPLLRVKVKSLSKTPYMGASDRFPDSW